MPNAAATVTPIKRAPKRAPKRRRRPTRRAEAKWAPAYRTALAGAMSGFSLALGTVAIELWVAELVGAYVLAVMTLAVLSVSLPHVADGISRLTGASPWEARALTVAIDAAALAGKAALMLAPLSVGGQVAAWCLMVGGIAFASLANVASWRR